MTTLGLKVRHQSTISTDKHTTFSSSEKFGKVLQSSSKKLHLKEHSVVGGDGTEHSLVTRFVCVFVCLVLLRYVCYCYSCI